MEKGAKLPYAYKSALSHSLRFDLLALDIVGCGSILGNLPPSCDPMYRPLPLVVYADMTGVVTFNLRN
jgi:hypothetical protein